MTTYETAVMAVSLPIASRGTTARPAARSALLASAVASVLYVVAPQALAADELEEIIVTANRREENLQTVAASIQVLSGNVLEQNGARDFASYLNSVSGIGMTITGSGSVKVGVRGVSNVIGGESGIADSTSTVGLYLNDVPIQGSGPLPDLALYDLQRIEVLKGPQGTLYGEGAMGGAIKMILNSPNPDAFEAKAETAVETVTDGGTNFLVQGAVNLPIIDEKMAARLVATYRNDDGFIDNIRTGEKDVNSGDALSARGMLDWQVTDEFRAELLVLHQEVDRDEFDEQVTGAGDLKTDLIDERFSKVDFDLYALTLRYEFGGAELVSSSSYWKNDRTRYDRNGFTGDTLNFFLSIFDAPPAVAETDAQGFDTIVDQKAFTQEIRLSSTGDQRVDWSIGAIYRSAEQDSVGYDVVQDIAAVNAVIAADIVPILGPDAIFQSTRLFGSQIDEQFDQIAVFGEVKWTIVDRLDLTVGARWFDEDMELRQVDTAYDFYALTFAEFGIPNPDTRDLKANDSDVIGRIGLSYQLSQDAMMYAMVSQGFRSGGPNFNGGIPGSPLPSLYESDSLVNYEIGAKTAWLEGRLLANLALYRVDWSDLQVRAQQPGLPPYITNAGEAEITGGDLQISVAPNDGVRLGLNLGILDSEITDLGEFVSGQVGQPLPNAPETTASAYLEFNRPVGSWGLGVARLDWLYVDKQVFELIPENGDPNDYFLPSYETVRLQFGIENERWSTYLYAENLLDERGITSEVRFNPPLAYEERLSVIRPRTIGVRFGVNF